MSFELPIGTVIAFAGPVSHIPAGWLLCDGRELESSDYRKLYNVIQTYWGGDNTSQFFKLPDLRGLFLRGVTGITDVDPDVRGRTFKGPNHLGSQNEVGSYQEDAFANHTHDIPLCKDVEAGSWKVVKGRSDNGSCQTGLAGGKTSTETRPKNAYVHYLIYAGSRD